MVRAKSFSVGYGKQVVLRRLTFHFARNQTTVILGPGGSGKSTLIQALSPNSGEGRWTRGRIFVASSHVGTLQQKGDDPLRELLPLKTGHAHRRAVLDRVWGAAPEASEALRPWLDKPLEALPAGLGRLVRLTEMAASDADLLLLDEPDMGMTDEQRVWTSSLLQSLRHQRTIVLVTHHIALAREVSDHALLLIDGSIVESAAHEQFFEAATQPRTREFLRLGC